MTGPLRFRGGGRQDARRLIINDRVLALWILPSGNAQWLMSIDRRHCPTVSGAGRRHGQSAREGSVALDVVSADGVSAPSVCERGGVSELLSYTRLHTQH